MFITELEDIVSTLKTRLEDYLILHKVLEPGKKKFNCIAHNDKSPSMVLNPKTDYTTAHCFACNANIDIFTAAELIEKLPSRGTEWVTETIPALAAQLNIALSLGEPSALAKIKAKHYQLANDIATILTHPKNEAITYISKRNWNNTYESCYQMDADELVTKLLDKNWDIDFIWQSGLIGQEVNRNFLPFVGPNYVTTVIKDHRKRPVAFVSRNIVDGMPKYIHSLESPIFNKSEVLLGLDLATKLAKYEGLYIVEGIGERNQMLRGGKVNIAACIGTALTEKHLFQLKDLGIRNIYLCLDWDLAGQSAIERIVKTIQIKKITGFNVFIIPKPEGEFKDLDDYLTNIKAEDINEAVSKLIKLDIFNYYCSKVDIRSLEEVNSKLIPIIASSPVAMIRETQIKRLSELTGLSESSVLTDVEAIRNQAFEIQRERVLNSIDKYKSSAETDPANASALISLHEKEVQQIEQEFAKASVGVNYQIQRFEAIQAGKLDTQTSYNEFIFSYYKFFAKAFSNGLPWTEGTLFYFGGRENAGKTATMIALASDVAFSDQDAIVLCHFTDDNYKKVEGRFLTNFAFLQSQKQRLSIFEANNPTKIDNAETSALYKTATLIMKNLISTERLAIIDAEDGTTLAPLERALRYYRHKYPNKKLLVVCDK